MTDTGTVGPAPPDSPVSGASPVSPVVPRQGGQGRDGTVAEAFDVRVVPVGHVAGYPKADTAAEAAAVLDVLRRIGGQPVAGSSAGPGTVDSLGAADDELARWSGEYGEPGERHPKERPSALVWLGHGRRGIMGPTLLVPGSAERGDHAQLTPDLFAHHLYAEWGNRRAEDGHWAMVVIEACKSSDFAKVVRERFDRSAAMDDAPYSILLIATGKDAAQAYLGTFRETLEDYLDALTSHDVFELHELRRFFKQAGHYCEFGGESCAELKLLARDRVPLPGVTTVAEQRRRQREFDAAPVPAPAVGVTASTVESPEERERAGYLEVVPHFTGREAELAEVLRWGTGPGPGPERVLIVPGAPGVGKSAFLGQALRRLRESGARIGAVLRLTGSTVAEVRDRLEGVGASRAPGGEWGPVSPEAAERILVVADALDEARDPVPTAQLLLAATEHPQVSLIIGTRRAPGDDGDPEGARIDLPTVLGSHTGRARVLELLPDPVAAGAYAADGVRRALREGADAPRDEAGALPQGADPGWAEVVAETVRAAVEQHVREGDWQFLQAALLVQEIEGSPGVLSSDPEAWQALLKLLDRDRSGLFGAAVARIGAEMPMALPFLRALALGHGRGLPRADGIWLRAASALAGPGGCASDERTLTEFLGKAAAYVLLDGEDRRSVYRLAHRTYAERLAAEVTAEQRLAMLTALLELAAGQIAEGRPPSPHLESRLAEYAADCGASGWHQLAAQKGVLDRLRVAALCGLALAPGRRGGGTVPTDLPIEILGTVTSAHLIERSTAADRPGLRQLGGLRACGEPHPAGDGGAWEVCWGAVRRTPPHLQLDAGQMVTAVAARPDRSWLVSGARDGSVTLWEPWRTHAPVLLTRGSDSPVTAVAASGAPGTADGPAGATDGPSGMAGDVPGTAGDAPAGVGPALVVSAHEDRTLRIWRPGAETDARAGERVLEAPEPVWQLVALPDGRFAVAGETGWVAVLHPGADGERGGARLSPAPGAPGSDVVGLASVTGPEGEPWLAVAERAGDLTLWEVAGEVPRLLHTMSLRRQLVALTVLAGAELAVACEDGSLWRWDASSEGHAAVQQLNILGPAFRAGSSTALVGWQAGDSGWTVLWGDPRGLWAMAVDQPRRSVGGGAGAGVRGLAVLAGPDGRRVVAAAAERGPAIHFWDPSAHLTGAARRAEVPFGRIIGMHRYVTEEGAEALALCHEVRTPGWTERTVRVLGAADGRELGGEADRAGGPGWDGAEGRRPEAVTRAHQGDISGLVALRGRSYRGMWASADDDGEIQLWATDPPPARRLTPRLTPGHRIRLGSPVLGLSALSGGRLAVAFKDGVVVLSVAAAGTRERDTGAVESSSPRNDETGDQDG
ncbi:AAA family ATPase [Streptomyces sp. NPDC093018]|uniref:AAA family ATPase n=1 Tax=Streptomyces sp. NPDC093018 TaxID=3155067 RepID=UPI00342A60DC